MLMSLGQKFFNIGHKARNAYDEAKANFWKFLFVDAIGVSGFCFLIATYSLSLSAGSASNGSYSYHWTGIGLMFIGILLARLGF